jgi:hypothetical protein
MKLPHNSHKLLDYLLTTYKLKNDAQLARSLNVGPPCISKIRGLKNPVSDKFRCIIIRNTNLSLEKIDELAPPESDVS